MPVGVALSGGIDSSAIVSTIRHLYPNVEIKTFSYIASEANISEAKWIEELNDFVNDYNSFQKKNFNKVRFRNFVNDLFESYDG